MTDIVERLRCTVPCQDMRAEAGCHCAEAADQITRLRAANERLANLVQCLIDNDPNEAITDAGHTVLDKWRYDARAALEASNG